METITVARPYAKAVFQFAVEQKLLEEWSLLLDKMVFIASDKNMKEVLFNPEIPSEQRLDIFFAALGKDANEYVKNFLSVVAEYQRFDVLPDVAAEFKLLYAAYKKERVVEVTSAFELNSDEKARLSAALEKRLNCKVELHSHIDETILGGAIVRVGDLVIDGSGRTKLTRLVEYLKGNALCNS